MKTKQFLTVLLTVILGITLTANYLQAQEKRKPMKNQITDVDQEKSNIDERFTLHVEDLWGKKYIFSEVQGEVYVSMLKYTGIKLHSSSDEAKYHCRVPFKGEQGYTFIGKAEFSKKAKRKLRKGKSIDLTDLNIKMDDIKRLEIKIGTSDYVAFLSNGGKRYVVPKKDDTLRVKDLVGLDVYIESSDLIDLNKRERELKESYSKQSLDPDAWIKGNKYSNTNSRVKDPEDSVDSNNPPNYDWLVHPVKKGEYLWGIATEYRSYFREGMPIPGIIAKIKSYNPEIFKDGGVLQPGDKLRIKRLSQ